jgi:integrase
VLFYEGRTLKEVTEHLGHADPDFTARTYAHVMRAGGATRSLNRSARTASRLVVDPG